MRVLRRHRGRKSPEPLLDRFLGVLGLARRRHLLELLHKVENSYIKLEGHVWAELRKDGALLEEVYLGENVITQRMRANVAGLIARTAPAPPGSYIGDLGFTEADIVFPVRLGIGLGTTPALTEDTGLVTPITLLGTRVFYELDRIFVRQNPASYGADPIHVAFFFEIPSGESYDDPGGGTTTNLTIEEWGLFDDFGGPGPSVDNRLLARKVAEISKLSELDLTIRWEIRT